MVMVGEDIPKQIKAYSECYYPGDEESDDEDLDAMSESYDIQMGKIFKFFQLVLGLYWANY